MSSLGHNVLTSVPKLSIFSKISYFLRIWCLNTQPQSIDKTLPQENNSHQNAILPSGPGAKWWTLLAVHVPNNMTQGSINNQIERCNGDEWVSKLGVPMAKSFKEKREILQTLHILCLCKCLNEVVSHNFKFYDKTWMISPLYLLGKIIETILYCRRG